MLCVILCYCGGVFPTLLLSSVVASILSLIEGSNKKLTSPETDWPVVNAGIDVLVDRFVENTMKRAINEPKQAKLIRKIIFKVVWSLDNSDSFYDFIRSSETLLVDDSIETYTKLQDEANKNRKFLTRSSFLGRFVHNMLLSFKYLEFEKSILIWKAFEQYRRDSKYPELHNNVAMPIEGSIYLALSSSNLQTTAVMVIPQADLSNLIEHQINLIEAFGTPTPPEILSYLDLLTKIEPGALPSGHYIKYLECLRNNDYEGSLDNLHRFFDYMMSSRHRPIYHYALLSLATLYATFGANQQAINAIGEAITVARENKDLTCLNYLLTWVYNFAKDHPQLKLFIGKEYSDKHKILNFLRLRTKESKDTKLQSLFYQFRAVQELDDQGQLAKIFEDFTLSSYFSLYYDEENDITPMDYAIFAKNCRLTSSLWSKLGIMPLLEIYLDIGLDTCRHQPNIYEEVEISIKKAYIYSYKDDYDSAFEIFDKLESSVLENAPLFKIWESRRLALTVRMHLKEGKNHLASAILSKLTAQSEAFSDEEFLQEITTLKSMLEETTL